MRKPLNPFIITGYHSSTYFCDREKEFSWLKDQCINERNAVLYSLRRMGKTALITHFFRQIKKDLNIEGIYVDLLGTTSIREANKRIAKAIIEQLGDIKRSGLGPRLINLLGSIGATFGIDPLSGTPNITIGLVKDQNVPDSLEAIGKYLDEYNKQVIICIDEFQQIVNYSEKNAEAIFRTWMQQHPMLRFVYCGSHRQMMHSMFSEESRPFYRSAQLLQLEALPRNQYHDFINMHFNNAGKKINNGQIEKIFKWARMQTHYIQLVCNKIYGKTESVSNHMLEETFNEIILQDIPLFSSYQRLLTNFQWKLLIAISLEEEVENPYSKFFLKKYDLGALSSVRRALQTLISKELVVFHDQKYFIHDTLLMRWLQQL